MAGQVLPHVYNDGVAIVNYGNVGSVLGALPGGELFLASNLVTLWGSVESLGGGTDNVILLADINVISHIEDTFGNDNHVFFRNVAGKEGMIVTTVFPSFSGRRATS